MAFAAASTSHAFAAGAMASTAGLTAAGSSTSRSSCAFQCAGLPPLRLVKAASRKPVGVRCEAGSDGRGPLTEIRENVDRATKRNLTKDDILRHQETDESEKRSVFGAKPTSGAPYPRPEIERRPETGDTSFTSVFAFDGAAPELINGRLAMVGFVWALVAEKLTGLTVLEQLWSPTSTGLVYFVGAVQLLTYASLVPIANGESSDARRWGPFNAKAERWNGRLAMLGFAALIIDELFRGVPLIH